MFTTFCIDIAEKQRMTLSKDNVFTIHVLIYLTNYSKTLHGSRVLCVDVVAGDNYNQGF